MLANGSATHFDQVIPANSFAEGVPAVVKKQNITDEDRKAYFGLIPAEWTRYEGSRQEENARKKPTTIASAGQGDPQVKARLLMFVLPLTFLSVSLATGQDRKRIVTVVPEETDEILANPGMGWETFHRTSKADKNLPSWIPSTVQYARWGWRELEPQPGKIDYAFLDRVLKESHDSGQKLAFRVMCCSPYKGRPYHPDWLKEIGGRILIADHNGVEPLPIPDMDDPVILNRHLDFIKRLGERYDGHPDLDHLDLGSIGWWGEWHLSGSKNCKLPTLENRMKVVDAYLAAFKKTPLVMLINGKECTAYATQHGTGWRADSMGDLGSFSPTWNHMRQRLSRMDS